MNKYRMTPQKRVILEELKKTKRHPTAEELYQKVKERLPEISIGTVYRNLEILTSQGEAQKITNGGRKKRYDGNSLSHYHIKCNRCGKVDDLPEDIVEFIKKEMQFNCDYEVTGYNLFFYGICPDCKNKTGGE